MSNFEEYFFAKKTGHDMISGFNKLLVAPIHYSVQDQFEKQYLDDTVVRRRGQ